jgi:hypothetical protein
VKLVLVVVGGIKVSSNLYKLKRATSSSSVSVDKKKWDSSSLKLIKPPIGNSL